MFIRCSYLNTGLAAANNSMRQGDVIFETLFTNNPSGEDIQYSVSSGVADSYNIGTDDLFVLDISK